jgi:hypothetical protein
MRLQLGVAAIVTVLTCGCGGHAGGDPGDRRLHELADDRVFSRLPASATAAALTRTAARHVQPAFEAEGWDGPSVVFTFGASGRPQVIFRFVADLAAAAGWHPTKKGALHLADAWTKTYPDGAAATLVLTVRPVDEARSEHTYTLAGGISLRN